jgi:hypothetical protein
MVRKDLEKAYELIQRERLEDALVILKPITQSNPDNADAWWLMANAASEPRDARRALVNVLKLKPSHPQARDLLDKLNEMYPPRDDELLMMLEIEDVEHELPSGPLDETSFDLEEDSSDIDSLFTSIDEDDGFEAVRSDEDPFAIADDDFVSTVEEDDPFANLLAEDAPRQRAARSGGRRILGLVALLALIGILAVALFVVLNGGDDDTTEDVDVEADPGDLVVADAAAFSADKADELESVRLVTEQDAKAAVDPSAEAVYVQVDDGLALMVKVCASTGPSVPRLVQNAFRVVAQRSTIPSLTTELTMVGVSVQDCTNQDVLYRAMAASTDAAAFTNQSTDYATFQRSWQNVES